MRTIWPFSLICRRFDRLERMLSMISAAAQAIIDEVTAIRALDQAAVTAVNGLVGQIADFKTTVDDLKARAGESGPISALDLAAIQASLAGLHETATALQAAIPAGTGAPTDPVTGAATGASDRRRVAAERNAGRQRR